jgi:hypothetical protein
MKRTVALCLAASLLMVGCYMAGSDYYVKNPMTCEQLQAKWGPPGSVLKMDVETEKWMYPMKGTDLGDRYFLVRDGRVLDSGIQP